MRKFFKCIFMRKSIFIGIFAVSALSSTTALGQVTAVGCTMDTSKYSSAIGYQTKALGVYSLASGYGVNATAYQSYIFGTKQTGGGISLPSLITTNDTERSFMIVFEGHPVFFAQLAPLPPKGRSDTPDPNSFYTGTPAVGIGTIEPQEALDVRGNIMADGNIQADTVKIKHSIFLPEKELSFTYYSAGTNPGGQEDEPIGEEVSIDGMDDGSNSGSGVGTSGVKTIMVLKDNKVGIGTVDPQARFHVSGNGLLSGALTIGNSSTISASPQFNIKMQIGNAWAFADKSFAKIMGYNCGFLNNGTSGRYIDGNAAAVMLNTDGSIQLRTASYGAQGASLAWNYLTMLNNGDVGIGKTNPQYKLDVNGDAASDNLHTNNIYFHGSEMKIAYIGTGPNQIEGNGTGEEGGEGDPEEGDQGEGQNRAATDIITINNRGKVGIGVTSPQATLDVSNNIHAYFLTLDEKGKMKDLEVTNRLGIGTADPKVNMQIGNIWTFYDGPNNKIIGRNSYWNGGNFERIQQGFASQITFDSNGNIMFHTAATGNAGSTISSWNTVAMNNNGSVGIGTTDTGDYKLKVEGKINCTEVVVTAGGIQRGDDEWPDYVFGDDYNLRSLDEVASYIEQHQRLPEIPSAADVAEKGVSLLEINTLLLKKVEELTLYIIDLQNQVDELKKR